MVSRGIRQIGVLYIVLFSLYTLHCRGSWMWLGITPVGVPEKQGCTDLPLTNKQKDLCKRKPHLLTSIKDGARLGIAECQAQFRIERWNCTITKELSVFGYELTSGTKETAFIYAVMAAGLVHAVTRACSAGNVTECSCDTSLQGGATPTQGWQWGGASPTQGWEWGGASPTQGWQWGGCSDDIQYGTWFSRRFFDGSHRNKSAAGGHALLSVNRHNSEAGRQAVAKTMSTDCRCHGISGSCAVRTCWRAMAPFERVGSFLKDRYEDSVQVQGRPLQVMRRKDGRPIPIGEEELVFLKTSPSYCLEDRRKGVAGTRGRQCDRSSAGPGGCGLLCCGRGYNTRVEQRVERCECRFVWCCYVRCLRCENISDTHTCK